MNAITLVRITLVLICAVLAWWFVIRYARLPWKDTEEGAHLMRFTLVIAIILTLWAGFAFFEVDQDLRTLIGIPAFSWVAWELWTRLQLLEQAQAEVEADRKRLAESDSESASQ